MKNELWNKKFKEFWKPLLQTNGKYNEQKIKNELHDLDFIADQISKIYCELTGGALSKPMYYAKTILNEVEERYLDKDITKDDIEMFIKECKTKKDLIENLKDYFEL
jgi:hypothetical protein